jgi:hypothetical protein
MVEIASVNLSLALTRAICESTISRPPISSSSRPGIRLPFPQPPTGFVEVRAAGHGIRDLSSASNISPGAVGHYRWIQTRRLGVMTLSSGGEQR